MLQDFTDISSISESQLTEEEALQLADELSGKLSEGEIPKSDADSLNGWSPDLGTREAPYDSPLQKVLEQVGTKLYPFFVKHFANTEM